MTNHKRVNHSLRTWHKGLMGALLLAVGSQAGAQIVSQQPLSAGGNVPGNLVLTPSVEWPTVDSVANIAGSYTAADTYVGYFDSLKCYKYKGDGAEADRYFFPVQKATGTHVCDASAKLWSGNFLNWATTPTIDPFRKAMTGGQRSTDSVGTTILEKARVDDQAGTNIFPDRNISGATTTANATPAPSGWGSMNTRARGLGIKMRFTQSGNLNNAGTPYDPLVHTLGGTAPGDNRGTVFEVIVRVKVCDPNIDPIETNCVSYSATNWKPEGLMQKYSKRMRYSVFGYLNNDGNSGYQEPNGAPLRARQKFIGPQRLNKTTNTWETNPEAEWDSTTGVMATNPDSSAVASGSVAGITPAISNSGAMNYLNKFGSMTNGKLKSHDPVSEMYWAAIRYLRNQGNHTDYSTLPTALDTAKTYYKPDGTTVVNVQYVAADGFPVFTAWGDDPIEYSCQNNAILGIGDVYTHQDRKVPGGEAEGWAAETGPGPAFNASTWKTKISELEFNNGSTITNPLHASAGRGNSMYIAAAAYWAHTTDIRDDANKPGKQTVSTYWVDVRENRRVEARQGNQYFLAAKYGGFQVPNDYDPTATSAVNRPKWTANDSWWWNNAETIKTGAVGDLTPDPVEGEGALYTQETFKRPDNYYVGDQASKMVSSLNNAFAKIASERAGSGSSLAANSTRLDTNTRVYQAQFRNGSWFGQINAFAVNATTGAVSTTPDWQAGTNSTLKAANWAARNIWMHNPANPTATKHVQFLGSNLSAAQSTALTFTGMGTRTSSDIVDYLRGKQAFEESLDGVFRTRTPPEPAISPLLGDIVNSTPIYVGAPTAGLYNASTPDFTGKADYAAFVTAKTSRTKALWVGANDGMMHAFNAETGAELYAFVPNASIVNGLAEYANPDYVHKYFVDGDVAVADVYMGGAWKTVLVGTMGRGGPGIFALDITNPLVPVFLWEKGPSDTDMGSLGRNIGRPVIAQVADGDWRVILGNGVDSATGDADLISIELANGTPHVVTTGADSNNGLSAVLVRDSNGDGFAETAYAGDLKGGLWKFGTIDATGSATKIYSALNSTGGTQPITAAPLVGRDPSTGTLWVFFGTGQYLGSADVADASQQTWYGIKDNSVVASGRSTLEQRTSTAGTVIGGFQTRVIETGTVGEIASKQGWYYDLPASKERMVSPNRFQGSALIGTTRIPDNSDVCNPGGSGFIMAINPFTGGRLEQTFFDTNRDGVFNDSDKTGGDIVSGIGLDRMPNAPIFVENVALISLASEKDGTQCTATTFACNGTGGLKVQGSSVDVSRMSWREITN